MRIRAIRTVAGPKLHMLKLIGRETWYAVANRSKYYNLQTESETFHNGGLHANQKSIYAWPFTRGSARLCAAYLSSAVSVHTLSTT